MAEMKVVNRFNEPASQSADLPSIVIGPSVRGIVDLAEGVLGKSGEIYRHRGGLVQVANTEDGPEIQPARPERIREVLASGAEWLSMAEPVLPPQWVLETLLARGAWPSIPSIDAVVQWPILRPDGSVLIDAGYDQMARVVYRPVVEVGPLPATVDLDAATDAASVLTRLVGDLPFEAESDLSAWVAGLLTIFARHAFGGPAPILVIEGRPGVGKSLLAEITHTIATGHPGRRPASISGSGPVALYDRTSGPVSAAWADDLTRSNALAIVAGSDLEIETGAARRCLQCRLYSPTRWPDRRAGFEHADLINHAHRERPALVAAALTILVGYIQAGEPEQDLTVWGGFEGFALVRGAMVWAGLEDPALSNEILRTEVGQIDDQIVAAVLDGWTEIEKAHRCAPSISEALGLYALGEDLLTGFRDALAQLCGTASGRLPEAKAIQRLFADLRGRVVNGRALEAVGDSSRGRLWSIKGERQ